MELRDDRQPLPSEDTGDLVEEPAAGQTDDPIVATEEGVPYVPRTDRVISEPRDETAAPGVAGTDSTDAGELEREDMVQPTTGSGELPRDDELTADVIEALRTSDVVAGDRIRVAAAGSRVMVAGEVESVDVLEEILGIVGDVPGVDEVVDEIEVASA